MNDDGETQDADDSREDRRRRYRSAWIFIAVVVAALIFYQQQRQQAESNAGKYVCELRNGAGNCVKSGGEWVRRGSSPLYP